jgi:hypothetical protein
MVTSQHISCSVLQAIYPRNRCMWHRTGCRSDAKWPATSLFQQMPRPKGCCPSVYEKEALAILEALKKWRHYLLGNRLIIKTNQQSLRFMATQKLTEGIQHKLLLKLLEFDYTTEYKKRKGKHCNGCTLAKGLSLPCHYCVCSRMDRRCQVKLHSRP